MRCLWDIKIETECEVKRMNRGGRKLKKKKKSQRSRWKFHKKNVMEADTTIFQKKKIAKNK